MGAAYHPAYRVRWSPEDGKYVATCAKYPSLSWLDPSPSKALTGLERVIAETVDGPHLGDRVVVNGGMGDYDTGTLADIVAGMALVNIDKDEGGTYPQWVQVTAVRKRS